VDVATRAKVDVGPTHRRRGDAQSHEEAEVADGSRSCTCRRRVLRPTRPEQEATNEEKNKHVSGRSCECKRPCPCKETNVRSIASMHRKRSPTYEQRHRGNLCQGKQRPARSGKRIQTIPWNAARGMGREKTKEEIYVQEPIVKEKTTGTKRIPPRSSA